MKDSCLSEQCNPLDTIVGFVQGQNPSSSRQESQTTR